MALPLTETDKFLLLSAVGAPETRDRIAALLDLAGTGNMTGPASATDNAVVRFDGTTGALVQNSPVILSDAGALSGLSGYSQSSGQILGPSGTVSLPGLSLNSDPDSGIYLLGANNPAFSAGGVAVGNFINTGKWVLGFAASTDTHQFLGGGIVVSGTLVGSSVQSDTSNLDNTDSSSNAIYRVGVGGASAGDPYLRMVIDGVVSFNQGLDNDDNDTYKWTNGGSPSDGTVFLSLTTAGAYILGASGNTESHNLNGSWNIVTTAGDCLVVSKGSNAPTIKFDTSNSNDFTFAIDPGTTSWNLVNNAGTTVLNINQAGAHIIGTGSSETHRLNSATVAAGSDALTFTNGPAGTAGDPDIYLQLNINGTNYVFPGFAV